MRKLNFNITKAEVAGFFARTFLRGTPWALLCTVALGVAKWGYHLDIPTFFVFFPLLLPWLIAGFICGLAFALFVIFWVIVAAISGVAWLVDQISAWRRRKQPRKKTGVAYGHC